MPTNSYARRSDELHGPKEEKEFSKESIPGKRPMQGHSASSSGSLCNIGRHCGSGSLHQMELLFASILSSNSI